MTPVQVLIVVLFVLASVAMVVLAVVGVAILVRVSEYVRLAGDVLRVAAAVGDETRRKVATVERTAARAAEELPHKIDAVKDEVTETVRQAVADAVPVKPGGRRAYDPPLPPPPVEESER